jgi:WD40 repeat protein
MLSCDGATLVRWPRGLGIQLWDVAKGLTPRVLKVDDGDGWPLALSPDSQVLASLGHNGESIKLWDLSSGKSLRWFSGRAFWVVLAAAFSPDGGILATGLEPWPESYEYYECRDTVQLWDVASGKPLRFLEGDVPGHDGPGVVLSVRFSPDGSTLASGTRNGTIKLWNVATGERRRTLAWLDGEADAVAFSPDGATLASGDEAGVVALWDVAANRKPHKLKGHEGAVVSVAFSPDGRLVASGSGDATTRLWDIWTGGRELHTLAGHQGPVTSVAFSPDGLTLASESEDGTVKIWDPETGSELHSFDTLQGL